LTLFCIGTAGPFSCNRLTLHDIWPKYDDIFILEFWASPLNSINLPLLTFLKKQWKL